MGGPIGYSSTDTGTKQPVVIMLKPSNNKHPSDRNKIECRLRNRIMDIRDLQDAMKQIMMSTTTILAEELELEISVPNGVHAVFVDLPGIKVWVRTNEIDFCWFSILSSTWIAPPRPMGNVGD